MKTLSFSPLWTIYVLFCYTFVCQIQYISPQSPHSCPLYPLKKNTVSSFLLTESRSLSEQHYCSIFLNQCEISEIPFPFISSISFLLLFQTFFCFFQISLFLVFFFWQISKILTNHWFSFLHLLPSLQNSDFLSLLLSTLPTFLFELLFCLSMRLKGISIL